MYNKLKHIEGVNLLPKEVVGPALVGSVEYFDGEKSTYHGSLVATTHRLFLNLEDNDLVCVEEISFENITRVTVEELLLVGHIFHIWQDDKLLISIKSISEGKLDKFLEFYYKYKAQHQADTVNKEAFA
ncbi:PH domain-containing protein [Jeotgalicoccus psychrophilus]|uniref:PH domain-containing protein n=1 Tax=Jeotgalicoccus psychrophilus TaxID=157228 RepID=UPI00041B775C|nr:PH domain-containing protein [Jeotgalicoccus psychrophilus]